MNIRTLEEQELPVAMHLVWEVFAENIAHLYSPEGVEEFREFIKIDHITELYNCKELYFWGAYEGDELLGVGAMYKSGHISLLDIKPQYQSQGIGRALFETMKQFCAQSLGLMRLTVNSAPSAVKYYQGLGFKINAQEQTQNGIRYVPMDFLISPAEIQRQGKKSQTGLLIGIIAATVLIGISVVIVCFRAFMNVVPNNVKRPAYEKGLDDKRDDDDSVYDSDSLGIEGIPVYDTADSSYSINTESYYEEKYGSSLQLCMDVEYPQITELDSNHADKINQVLEDCAMETANALYVSPTDETKEYLLGQEYIHIGSQVRYKVTYISEDIISVVFEDYYFWGTIYANYCDLRTRTINLKDGTVYEIKDIVNLDDTFMGAWYESMKEEAPDATVIDLLSLDIFKRVFEGEFVEDRYADAFFLKEGGLEIGLSYHYGDDSSITRGWMTAPFTWGEIAPYKTDNDLWKIVKSHN